MEDDTTATVNIGDQLKCIEAAQIGLKTPKHTRFNPVDEIREIAIDTQAVSLPKRRKFVKMKDIIKTENPEESKILMIGHIIQEWDTIITEIDNLYSSLNARISSDKKFQEKILDHNLNLHSDIIKSEDMSRLLKNELGETHPDWEGTNIWEAIHSM